jgi:hypothetical protein
MHYGLRRIYLRKEGKRSTRKARVSCAGGSGERENLDGGQSEGQEEERLAARTLVDVMVSRFADVETWKAEHVQNTDKESGGKGASKGKTQVHVIERVRRQCRQDILRTEKERFNRLLWRPRSQGWGLGSPAGGPQRPTRNSQLGARQEGSTDSTATDQGAAALARRF